MKSIHDNNCHGFEFDGRQHSLVLHTTFSDKSTVEDTDIIFTGVWMHHFEGVQDGNIIFDIEEVDFSIIQTEFADIFKRMENECWPIQTKEKMNLTDQIGGGKIKTYRINTSYGMNGFVVAERMTIK